MTELEQICKKKFAHLTNQQLVSKINQCKDFGWDDEGIELNRRIEESNGAFQVKMDYNTLKIVN